MNLKEGKGGIWDGLEGGNDVIILESQKIKNVLKLIVLMGHVPSKKFNQRLLSRIYSIINIQNTDTGAREMAWQLSAGLAPNTHMGQLTSTCNNCRGQSIWLPRAHTLMCPNLTTTDKGRYIHTNK